MISSVFTILIILLVLLVPAAIVALIIFAIIKKGKDNKKGESFEMIVKTIYNYIVLIFFLFMFVGSVIYTFNTAVNFILPEKYTDNYDSDFPEEIKEIQKKNFEQSTQNRNIIDMTTAVSMIVISLPMFIYYGKQARNIGKK